MKENKKALLILMFYWASAIFWTVVIIVVVAGGMYSLVTRILHVVSGVFWLIAAIMATIDFKNKIKEGGNENEKNGE
ncbi:MAG: hypothetical protein GX897_01555 [Clostridiales bacterium]|nr:hypothetical protein [Clostridiales bacterium]